jgi:hypothetical protein
MVWVDTNECWSGPARSLDGGRHFYSTYPDPPGSTPIFASKTHWFAASSTSESYDVTLDAGLTWHSWRLRDFGGPAQISFPDSAHGWFQGSAYTNDGGLSFTLDSLREGLGELWYFVDSTHGWTSVYSEMLFRHRPAEGPRGVETPHNGTLAPPQASIRVYPNPSADPWMSVEFALPTAGSYTVQITDMLGRQRAFRSGRHEAGSFATDVDVASLQTGEYIVTLIQGRQVLARAIALVVR